jgi:hypothetical protein
MGKRRKNMKSNNLTGKLSLLIIILAFLSSCNVVNDLMNPSDMAKSVKDQNNIFITDISVSKNIVKNTGKDSFILTCTIKSAPDVNKVSVDASAVGSGIIGMVNDPQISAKWSVNLTVSSNTPAGEAVIKVSAENSPGYTASSKITVSVVEFDTFYVSTNGNDTNDGTIALPFYSIQKGLDASFSLNVRMVKVSAGRYTNNYNHQQYCVKLMDGISLTGGWDSTFSSRDPALTPSVIDGQGNTLHVVYAENIVNTNTTLDGFRITGGNANKLQFDSWGGGLWIKDSSFNIQNCDIVSNSADSHGGGISAYFYTGVVSNCAIINNTQILNNVFSGGGGAYFLLSGFSAVNCRFLNNTSMNNGGGICLDQCQPGVVNGAIIGNSALNSGGGIFVNTSIGTSLDGEISSNSAAFGGGIFLDDSVSNIVTAYVTNNTAFSSGGGICTNNGNGPNFIDTSRVTNNAGGDFGYN